jgi:hypothetical protein
VLAPVSVGGISVGDQEKRRREVVFVQDGYSLVELAPQPVVERERDKCWFIPSRFTSPQHTIGGLVYLF